MPRAALALSPAWRRRLGAALATLIVLCAGYWLWFRDSSFARVHDVYVTGLAGPQARSIRNALQNAGLDMSTLHVKNGALEAAVADYPIVRSVTATGDFPHKLTVSVDLNMPVGILVSRSGRTPVAADGLLLPDVPVTPGLPLLKTGAVVPSERVTGGGPFELVRVVSLAPAPLRARIRWVGARRGVGLVAEMTAGPELRFGSADRLPAKWIAAARVLASPASKGATYIDLSLPERPAAGGLPTTSVIPLAPAGAPTPTPAPPATTSATPATTAGPTTTQPTTTATQPTTVTQTSTTPATTPTQTTASPPPTATTPAAGPASPTTGGAVQAP